VTFQSDDDVEWSVSPFVYLEDEDVWGIITSYGAYVSRVKYFKDGVYYNVLVENEEFMDGD